ncbi:MAG: pseudouridine synthase [Pseudomonadales bacterium]|nr:pseudouridine synthase [Pseudomonadales bacterium]
MKANTQITDKHVVRFNGQTLHIPQPSYFMLHKPVNYVCSTDDPQHRSVMNLISRSDQLELHIVGRLDLDATGLLLLTSDGQWSHKVTSPQKQCAKTYQVHLDKPISKEAIDQLETGLLLKGESKITHPAQAEAVNELTINLTITEGRYHQVKRMLAAVGNHVVSLHRTRVGAITLDDTLTLGSYRSLTADEIASF